MGKDPHCVLNFDLISHFLQRIRVHRLSYNFWIFLVNSVFFDIFKHLFESVLFPSNISISSLIFALQLFFLLLLLLNLFVLFSKIHENFPGKEPLSGLKSGQLLVNIDELKRSEIRFPEGLGHDGLVFDRIQAAGGIQNISPDFARLQAPHQNSKLSYFYFHLFTEGKGAKRRWFPIWSTSWAVFSPHRRRCRERRLGFCQSKIFALKKCSLFSLCRNKWGKTERDGLRQAFLRC